jgi:hypothetical protein
VKSSQTTKWITKARFAPYLAEARGDHENAVAFYVWNAQITAALFETLHHVEVLLHHAIDGQFVPLDASAVPSTTWLGDPAILNEASRRRVHETIERIVRDGKTPTRGRVSRACPLRSGAHCSTRSTTSYGSCACTGPSRPAPATEPRSPR